MIDFAVASDKGLRFSTVSWLAIFFRYCFVGHSLRSCIVVLLVLRLRDKKPAGEPTGY